MRKIPDQVRILVHWSLLVVTVIYFISGFGITQFMIIEDYSFGLLTKNLAFKVHNNLWIPFIALLVLHVVFVFLRRLQRLVVNKKMAAARLELAINLTLLTLI